MISFREGLDGDMSPRARDAGDEAVKAFEKTYAEDDEARAERLREDDEARLQRKKDMMRAVSRPQVSSAEYDRLREQFVELEKRARLEAVKRQWQEGKFPGDWGVMDPFARPQGTGQVTITSDRTNAAPPPAPQPKPFVEPAKGRAPIAAGEETP